ncbi:MAG: acylneuraminate cytidylyltransferase family protein [Lachnospiraceae bacterium]|nr:acylneuraminate cytidylyltransferase family protein [Lachnospiraceae bacterium]
MHDYRMIAMIPARMGSRRIPQKNIRYMLDKPLIQYPIDLAFECGGFESIWINTESRELGKFCENLGVQFHKRPIELSGDTATNREFVYEFLTRHECDYVVMLNPTSPTLRLSTLNQFINFVRENEYDTVMSVASVKAEGMCKGNLINFDKSDKIPSEKLEALEYVVWAVTAWKRETFLALQEKGVCPVFGGEMATFTIPKDEAQDLDNEEDWTIAEAILKARQSVGRTQKKYLEL